MATDAMTTTPGQFPEETEMTTVEQAQQFWDDNFPDLSLEEIVDDLELEGLTEADLENIPDLIANYVGYRFEGGGGKQSIGWTDEQKKKALEAVGGGATDSASMSSRIWPKGVETVKAMGTARSEFNNLKTDPAYTRHHPRTGVRRVRTGMLEQYEEKLAAAKEKIRQCAVAMNEDRETIKEAAKKHLKSRYAAAAHVFDSDFTEMFDVRWELEELGVPPAVHQFQALREREARRFVACGAASILIEKNEVYEQLMEMLDDVNERMESRRVLDKKHEVLSIENAAAEGKFKVTYLDASGGQGSGRKPEKELILTQEQIDKRIKTDDRPKMFRDATPQKLLTLTEYWENVAKNRGVYNGPMEEVFQRLRKAFRGQTTETIAKQLRQSSGMREGTVSSIAEIGEFILSQSSLQGKRDVLRSKCRSATFNPNRQ